MSELVKASELKPPIAGARTKIPEDAATALETSFKKFGVLQPVVISEDGRVIIGDSRRQIATKLGLDVPTEKREGLTEFDEILMRLQEEEGNSPLPVRSRAEMVNRLYESANADVTRKNKPKLSATDLAKMIGISLGTFLHYRILATAPADVQKLLDENKVVADTVWQICNTKFSDEIKTGLIEAVANGRLPAGKELRLAVMQIRRLSVNDIEQFISSGASWDDFKVGLTKKPRPMKAKKPRGRTKKGTPRKTNTKAAQTEEASLNAKEVIVELVRAVTARMDEESNRFKRISAALVDLSEVLPFMRDSEWARSEKAVLEYVAVQRQFGELHQAYLKDLAKFVAAMKTVGIQAYAVLPEDAVRRLRVVSGEWEA